MLIGVPAETATGETRVAVTPETAKKLIAQGHTVRVQSGAGLRASATDDFCDFLGNLRLTSLVSNTRQVGYQVISVVSRSLHCSSTSCGLRSRSLQEHREKDT